MCPFVQVSAIGNIHRQQMGTGLDGKTRDGNAWSVVRKPLGRIRMVVEDLAVELDPKADRNALASNVDLGAHVGEALRKFFFGQFAWFGECAVVVERDDQFRHWRMRSAIGQPAAKEGDRAKNDADTNPAKEKTDAAFRPRMGGGFGGVQSPRVSRGAEFGGDPFKVPPLGAVRSCEAHSSWISFGRIKFWLAAAFHPLVKPFHPFASNRIDFAAADDEEPGRAALDQALHENGTDPTGARDALDAVTFQPLRPESAAGLGATQRYEGCRARGFFLVDPGAQIVFDLAAALSGQINRLGVT